MSKKITHYVAAGRKGLAFACFRDEFGAVRPNTRRSDWPNRSTSLDKVDCPECWREIRAMTMTRERY